MAGKLDGGLTGSPLHDVLHRVKGDYNTAGERVYGVLRQCIKTGAFAPGEWLRQQTLAEAFGVSRIPVRTALLQLEAEGLVSFHPHQGARVQMMSAQRVDEIFRLRERLEPWALRLSIARMDAARLARLWELANELDLAEPGDAEFIDRRTRFYRELYDAENNPLLVEFIEKLRNIILVYLLNFDPTSTGRTDHIALVRHIERNDIVSAEEWVRDHLNVLHARLLPNTKLAPGSGPPGADYHDAVADASNSESSPPAAT